MVALRREQLDTTGDVWRYDVPASANKTHYRGGRRVVWIGPRAQAVLRPLLAGPATAGPVFAFDTRGDWGNTPAVPDRVRAARQGRVRAGRRPALAPALAPAQQGH